MPHIMSLNDILKYFKQPVFVGYIKVTYKKPKLDSKGKVRREGSMGGT